MIVGALYVRITTMLERIKANIEYKSGNSNKFEYGILKDFLSSYERFGQRQLYQTHPALFLRGDRPTICRYIVYGLKDYLKKDMDVLDMGSNVGFFSLYVSGKVNSIDLIELNPKLCNICRKVRDKLKINNVNIINSNIVEYNFNKKYDMIFSFAVHGHIGIGLHRYLELLHRLLNEGGLVLFETHRVNDCNMNERELTTERDNILRNEQKLFDIIHEGVIDDQMGRMRRFFYLKKR